MGDGPKWVCDPYRITEKNDCLVYSIGSNNEFSFEEAVHAEIGYKCEIHTFDHTVGANPSNKPSYVTFHSWGIADKSSGGLKSLEDIITECKLSKYTETIIFPTALVKCIHLKHQTCRNIENTTSIFYYMWVLPQTNHSCITFM